MRVEQRVATVAALGSAQTLAWASSYYLPAMLATPMSKDPASRRRPSSRRSRSPSSSLRCSARTPAARSIAGAAGRC